MTFRFHIVANSSELEIQRSTAVGLCDPERPSDFYLPIYLLEFVCTSMLPGK
ncbi:hypothetical protein KP509_09G077500 [Ceratopteris richardii]|uniref:Uncharacterized protein n=1 Tax=Ceratopteris richardii TaxID=49495 RepID=A0A8T2U3Y5_CERRI|nr:hypothetical protein KP509_09G077400 [Ceratopteris richardii]KAH7429992.1 hypothetical protein KP509_09G077500 [Ceratopteris richardii]